MGLALALLGPPASAGVHAGIVDINMANAGELVAVFDGLSIAQARAIVGYRRAHGRFHSAEQLALVKGMDLTTVERNRERIRLDAASAPAYRQRGVAN